MQTLPKSLQDVALSKDAFVVSRVLAASTAETITVPPQARYALFSGDVDCWIDRNTTAVVPAADIENGMSPIFLPGGFKELREIDGIKTISVIATIAGIITVEFFK